MEITDIRIKKVSTGGKLKAYVTVTFDNCFVVHNLKIISGKAGTFIAMPSRKRKDGTFQDIAHPINMETREWMEHQVIAAYKQEVQRAESGQFPGDDGNDKGPGSMMEESY